MLITSLKKPLISGLFVATCLVAGNTHAAEPGKFKVSSGFDYSSGDYGSTTDTEIWYVPLTVKYDTFPWTTKVTVPWLQIKGPGGVVGGGESVIVVNPGATTTTTESGLGDIVASLSYSMDPISEGFPLLDFTGKIKFPTADEDKGLGTGEVDYTLQLDAAKIYGRWTPIATLGYKIKGDPAGVKLDNTFFASAGAAYKFSSMVSAGATLDYSESSTSTSDDAVELFAYLAYKLSPQWSINAYGVAGFTDGSPNEEIGMQFSFSPR